MWHELEIFYLIYGASHLVPQLAAPRGQFWEKSSKLRIVSCAQKNAIKFYVTWPLMVIQIKKNIYINNIYNVITLLKKISFFMWRSQCSCGEHSLRALPSKNFWTPYIFHIKKINCHLSSFHFSYITSVLLLHAYTIYIHNYLINNMYISLFTL